MDDVKLCSIDGCGNAAYCRSWCRKHYTRWLRNGTPAPTLRTDDTPPIDRFMQQVDKGDCWMWTGYTNGGGYALFRYDGHRFAHRWSYAHFVGPIPEGYEVDHLCSTPGCVRPDHLEAVPPPANMARAVERRTHCKRGHPFDEANTYVVPGNPRHRQCKRCQRLNRVQRQGRAS